MIALDRPRLFQDEVEVGVLRHRDDSMHELLVHFAPGRGYRMQSGAGEMMSGMRRFGELERNRGLTFGKCRAYPASPSGVRFTGRYTHAIIKPFPNFSGPHSPSTEGVMSGTSPEITLHHLLCSMLSLLQYYEEQVYPQMEELDELKQCIIRVRAKLDARIEAQESVGHRRPVQSDLDLERVAPEARRKL